MACAAGLLPAVTSILRSSRNVTIAEDTLTQVPSFERRPPRRAPLSLDCSSPTTNARGEPSAHRLPDRVHSPREQRKLRARYRRMPAKPKPKPKPTFDPADPLSLDTQLSDDERAVRDAARAYCQRAARAARARGVPPREDRRRDLPRDGRARPARRDDSRALRRRRPQLRLLRADRARGRKRSTPATAR